MDWQTINTKIRDRCLTSGSPTGPNFNFSAPWAQELRSPVIGACVLSLAPSWGAAAPLWATQAALRSETPSPSRDACLLAEAPGCRSPGRGASLVTSTLPGGARGPRPGIGCDDGNHRPVPPAAVAPLDLLVDPRPRCEWSGVFFLRAERRGQMTRTPRLADLTPCAVGLDASGETRTPMHNKRVPWGRASRGRTGVGSLFLTSEPLGLIARQPGLVMAEDVGKGVHRKGAQGELRIPGHPGA